MQQRFLSDYRDLMAWINSMMSLVTSEELGNDVTGSEALIERHQVRIVLDFHTTGDSLIQQHYSEIRTEKTNIQNSKFSFSLPILENKKYFSSPVIFNFTRIIELKLIFVTVSPRYYEFNKKQISSLATQKYWFSRFHL